MKYMEFMSRVERYRENTDQRLGQAMFNMVYDQDEILANKVRTTNADPFYDNDRIPMFLEVLHDDGFLTYE